MYRLQTFIDIVWWDSFITYAEDELDFAAKVCHRVEYELGMVCRVVKI